MTVQHAIVLFPALDAAADIEALRLAYDPLAPVLPAHVTVVFPFADANAPTFLCDHVVTYLAGMAPSTSRSQLRRPRMAATCFSGLQRGGIALSRCTTASIRARCWRIDRRRTTTSRT